MKVTSTTIVALTLFLSGPCAAQWTPVYQDNNVTIYDATFPTDHTGYVAALDTGGTVILRTHDGGASWDKRYLPGFTHLDRIAMTDSLKGYVIRGGTPAVLLRTNNGFDTYTLHTLDSCFIVQALCLLNDSTALYLNNGTRLRKFEHYGSTYSYLIDTLNGGQNLQTFEGGLGYLDTGYGLLQSTDAGTTWSEANADLGFYCGTFRFADPQNAYFSDENHIYTSSNGGATFTQQYAFPNVQKFAANGGFCMAVNDSGNVAFTFDHGLTWQQEATGINVPAPGPHTVITTPDGHCFLFNQFGGEMRMRDPLSASIRNYTSAPGPSVYPNPFSSQTTMTFGQVQRNSLVIITDVLGQVMRTLRFSGAQLTIEKGDLAAGIYHLHLTDEQGKQWTAPIVVQ